MGICCQQLVDEQDAWRICHGLCRSGSVRAADLQGGRIGWIEVMTGTIKGIRKGPYVIVPEHPVEIVPLEPMASAGHFSCHRCMPKGKRAVSRISTGLGHVVGGEAELVQSDVERCIA